MIDQMELGNTLESFQSEYVYPQTLNIQVQKPLHRDIFL